MSFNEKSSSDTKMMEFHLNDLVLPVSVEPFPDESGMSFCLRSISSNDANFHQLRKLVGVDPVGRFTSSKAFEIGHLLQCDSNWLRKTLPSPEHMKPYRRDFFGHRWYSRNHLRTQNPQVCVRCIHSKGYCRAIWDVSMSLVCIEHECFLIDACPKCRKPLRWDRPRVDVGHCGHLLITPTTVPVSEILFNLQVLLEEKFHQNLSNAVLSNQNHLLFFNQLSLSGVHAFITGFGAMSRPHEPISGKFRSKTYRSEEWLEIVCRGLERITNSENGVLNEDDLSNLLLESSFVKLIQNHDCLADQKLSLDLLKRVFKKKLIPQFDGNLQHLSQLELF